MSKLDIPGDSSTQGWKVSYYKLEEAVAFLEIEMPIMIRYMYGLQPTLGTHKMAEILGPFSTRETIHIIRLHNDLYPQRVSETLWHELAHARQVERAAKEAGIDPLEFHKQIYNKSKGGLGMEYLNNTFEVDARKVANANKHKELIA